MRRWAEFILRHRRAVVAVCGVVLVAGIALAGKTTSRLTVDFSLPGQPGSQTAHKINQAFGNGGNTSPYLVSVSLPAGQTVTGREAQVAKAFATVAESVPSVRVIDEANTGDKAFRTRDDRTAFALVFYRFNPSPSQQLLTTPIRDAAASAAPAGATVGVTGEDTLATGGNNNGPGVLGETMLGAVGALAVLAFVFASFLALLPLVVAAVSILATFVLLLPLTYLMDVSFIVQFLVALIGLGVAIDYSLLFVNRWREERDHGRDNHEAVVVAMQTAGRAVVFSGVTVAIGLLALIVLPVPFMRSMGIGGALIPLTSVLTTLTLTPAILGGIGPRIDWPKIRHENRASRAWSRWAALVVRRRWLAAGVALAALAALIGVFLGVKIGLAGSDSLARSGPAYDALQTLERGGVSTGTLTPIEVLVASDQAPAVAAALGKVDGVAHAWAPSGPASNRGGQSVVVLIPNQETVNSTSIDVVKRVKTAASHLPGVVGVTGIGAAQIDFLHAVYGNFPLMLIIIAVLTYLLLVRAFRSLLLPLKAVLLNLLSLGATLGLMVLFWQHGVGLARRVQHQCHRSDHLLDPADGLRVPVRPVDGLRGVHPVPHPRGVRRGAVHQRGGDRGHRAHRPAGHQRGADPVPRLRRARLRARHRPEDAGDRSRLRHPARRHHRPLVAGPVAGVTVRPVELVPARPVRPPAAGAPVLPAPRTRRTTRTPAGGGRLNAYAPLSSVLERSGGTHRARAFPAGIGRRFAPGRLSQAGSRRP